MVDSIGVLNLQVKERCRVESNGNACFFYELGSRVLAAGRCWQEND
jgi:hypothetical protein